MSDEKLPSQSWASMRVLLKGRPTEQQRPPDLRARFVTNRLDLPDAGAGTPGAKPESAVDAPAADSVEQLSDSSSMALPTAAVPTEPSIENRQQSQVPVNQQRTEATDQAAEKPIGRADGRIPSAKQPTPTVPKSTVSRSDQAASSVQPKHQSVDAAAKSSATPSQDANQTAPPVSVARQTTSPHQSQPQLPKSEKQQSPHRTSPPLPRQQKPADSEGSTLPPQLKAADHAPGNFGTMQRSPSPNTGRSSFHWSWWLLLILLIGCLIIILSWWLPDFLTTGTGQGESVQLDSGVSSSMLPSETDVDAEIGDSEVSAFESAVQSDEHTPDPAPEEPPMTDTPDPIPENPPTDDPLDPVPADTPTEDTVDPVPENSEPTLSELRARAERVDTVTLFQTEPVAHVTVRYQAPPRRRIVFIVDCSVSMSDNGRMAAVKESLREILGVLCDSGSCRAGLRVFGARSRWEPPIGVGNSHRREGHPALDAENRVIPDLDVELRVAVALLDASHTDRIDQEIAGLQPWGVSPIYQALQESLENDFRHDESELGQILLITDGVNDQLSPERSTPARDRVLALCEEFGATIQVDTLMLQADEALNDPQLERRSAWRQENSRKDLVHQRDICTITEGSLVEVDDLSQLNSAIRQILSIPTFTVLTSGSEPSAQTLELGETARIDHVDSTASLRVEIRPSEVPVTTELAAHSGQQLLLEFDPERCQLVFPAWDPPDPVSIVDQATISVPTETGGLVRVQALTPRMSKGSDRVEFPFFLERKSADNADAVTRSTPRPAQVIAEIQPQTKGGEPVGREYFFLSAPPSFDWPVVAYRLLADNWPPDASHAVVTLWFDFDALRPPDHIVEIPVLDDPHQFAVEMLPGVRFEVSTEVSADSALRRVVISQHSVVADARGVYCVTTTQAMREELQRFVGEDLLEQTFEFREWPDNLQIHLTDVSRIMDESVKVPELRISLEDVAPLDN